MLQSTAQACCFSVKFPNMTAFYSCKKIQVSVHEMGTHTEPLLVLCRFSVSPMSIHSPAKQGHKDSLKQKWRAVCMGTGHGTAARGWWRDEEGKT